MLLVGAGQGLAFAPMTSSGIAGVRPADAGAASGLVNTAHQLGMALGLGVLVAVSAHAGAGSPDRAAGITAQVGTALTGSSALLLLALVVALVVIVPAGYCRPVSKAVAPETVGRTSRDYGAGRHTVPGGGSRRNAR
jgi:hypothetical protein